MKYLMFIALVGCASLDRDHDVDATPETPDASVPNPGIDVPPLDALVEVCPPDAYVPPPCTCDADCDDGDKCHNGKCYDRCDCDGDCRPGYGCIYGLCKK